MFIVAGGILGTPVIYAHQSGSAARANPTDPTVQPKVVRIDFDMRKVAEPPALDEQQLRGRQLFVKYCETCHDGSARAFAPPLNQTNVTKLGEAGVRQKVTTGSDRMPGFRYALSATQIEQVVRFLKVMSK